MFSKRTSWDQELNDLHHTLEVLRSSGTDVIDGTESNPTRCGFTYPSHWLEALSNPSSFVYDPSPFGLSKTRAAVGNYCGVDPATVVLTASTSESYSFLFRLLMDPGDHVLVPAPSYPLFQFLVELNDAESDQYPLVYENGAWVIDFERLEGLVTPKTRAIVLVNPNNPTGSFISDEEVFLLNIFCKKHGIAIISDEVFWGYQLSNQEFTSLSQNNEVLTFALGGLSKALAMPQMKLGWILTSGPDHQVAEALARLEIIADTYLSVNTPVQLAALTWLPQAAQIQEQVMGRVRGNLEQLQRSGLDVLSVEGGWYGVIRTGYEQEEAFVLKLLKEHQVLLHPGFFYDFDESGVVVVSLLPQPKQFARIVEVLKQAI